ncbi:GntR family transcriptional regulator [Hansschlegelia sp.]|uniref:GntR family transcriptional regulator n=1 Tax=Hansschlegelia sp. TaxID=2041892 RepID=UPI002BCD21EF|nr:GntR family transcriptional regulator [Hansschlegelia sp.]HVI27085.1 GntR family transcriptional regulator [Hansschlegelia sp.]
MSKYAQIYERSRAPLYLQVALVMRQRISSGRWEQGAKIPTLEKLEQEFSVARVTVRQAIEMLQAEGLLDAQQGRGTFVSGKPKDTSWFNVSDDISSLVASLKNNVLKRVRVKENVAPPILASGEGEYAPQYAFLQSVQYKDGEPFSVVNLWLDQEVFALDSDGFKHRPALPFLMEHEKIKIVHAYQTVMIGIAEYETAKLLKIGLGEPISDCRLVLVNDAGIAIYIADIHYHKDSFRMKKDLLGGRAEQEKATA